MPGGISGHLKFFHDCFIPPSRPAAIPFVDATMLSFTSPAFSLAYEYMSATPFFTFSIVFVAVSVS